MCEIKKAPENYSYIGGNSAAYMKSKDSGDLLLQHRTIHYRDTENLESGRGPAYDEGSYNYE